MPRMMQVVEGNAGPTTRVALTDTAAVLADAIIVSGNRKAMRLTISVESNPMRFALGGVTPTQGAVGIGHKLDDGDILEMENQENIEGALFINETSGSTSVIQVTAEF